VAVTFSPRASYQARSAPTFATNSPRWPPSARMLHAGVGWGYHAAVKYALPFLLLLTACNGLRGLTRDRDTDGDDTDAASDTDDTDVPRDWDALVTMFTAVHAPAEWYYRVRDWRDDPPVCPSIEKTDDFVWTLSGGCTGADGTEYEGTIEHLDADYGERILFVGWRVITADSDLTYDGEIVLPNTNQLESEYAARDANDVVVYSYDNHWITTLDGWKTVYQDHQQGSYTYAGRFTAAGSGAFTISGTAEHDGKCDVEPDQGTLAFTGPKEVTFTFNGAAICEGCVPFVDEYGNGDICPWRDE
jgi:hypothetical protein